MKEWEKNIIKNKDYKRYVGPLKYYGKTGEIVLELFKKYGLRKTSNFLDIGCGSLSVGKVLIPFLNKGKYFAIEKNMWLVDEAISKEFDEGIIEKKEPVFLENSNFECSLFSIEYGLIFDYILCTSIFIHACKKQIEKCLKEVKEVMDKKSVFIFNFIEGKKDNELKEWSYPSSIEYTKTYIESLLNDFDYEYIEVPEYEGRQIWIKCQLKGEDNE